VEGSYKPTPPKIIICSNLDIDSKDAQEHLDKYGVAPIAKITDIVHLEEIPVLGTGKTDYKILRKMAEEL
jgi:long-chain-fatty-acid--[acyl-carrier-protein] ligase